MKHAGATALDSLAELLAEIRQRPGLTERQRGVFYRRGQAFLHFHEDPAGLFADLRSGGDWQRFPVRSAAEGQALLAGLDAALTSAAPTSAGPGPARSPRR